FSTKLRRNLIKPELQSDLWSFLGGIARKNGCKALIVGGTENHVHILLSLPADKPLAKAMQLIKGTSSRWMNETHSKNFAWKEYANPARIECAGADDAFHLRDGDAARGPRCLRHGAVVPRRDLLVHGEIPLRIGNGSAYQRDVNRNHGIEEILFALAVPELD